MLKGSWGQTAKQIEKRISVWVTCSQTLVALDRLDFIVFNKALNQNSKAAYKQSHKYYRCFSKAESTL